MYNTLRDSLAVLVCQFLDQVDILQQDRSARASRQRVLIIPHWVTRCCCQHIDIVLFTGHRFPPENYEKMIPCTLCLVSLDKANPKIKLIVLLVSIEKNDGLYEQNPYNLRYADTYT